MQDLPVSQASYAQMLGSTGSMFGFTLWGFGAGLIYSIIGYFYLRAGKRERNIPTMTAGVALMLFPYFVTKTSYIVLAGAGIMALHYFNGRLD
ncbi:MAG TPA: hypothetical protein PKI19_04220 [Elusimicrobiales bacterium]|nr:hypothetical protein [Elusimicrobiales bacterium]